MCPATGTCILTFVSGRMSSAIIHKTFLVPRPRAEARYASEDASEDHAAVAANQVLQEEEAAMKFQLVPMGYVDSEQAPPPETAASAGHTSQGPRSVPFGRIFVAVVQSAPPAACGVPAYGQRRRRRRSGVNGLHQ